MLNRFKSAIYNVVGNFDITEGIVTSDEHTQSHAATSRPNGFYSRERIVKHAYSRPPFLQLSAEEEILISGDQSVRPIICPRDGTVLPWNVGYAETINAGKSRKNEDQAAFTSGCLKKTIGQWVERPCAQEATPDAQNAHCTIDETGDLVIELPYHYFGVFDGHAGWGAAVSASKELHHIIHDKLLEVFDLLLPQLVTSSQKEKANGPLWYMERTVTPQSAVIGALEQAFCIMDERIAADRLKYQLNGGCTACVGVFILGQLFVSNAGDSRGILCRSEQPFPMSFDFTPETEIYRIKKLGAMQPELLGGEFTHLEFLRRPMKRDLGKKAAYRDHNMTGWAYKTITPEDLKYPLVCGEGKRSRVLATIGVTRGFGDHDLRAQNTSLAIKPFLTAEPEVRVFDIENSTLADSDVLILGTDGLWDITSNQKAVSTVLNSIKHFPSTDLHRHKYRYITAAQDLVMCSRGKMKDYSWRTSEDKHATIDDISVFVIPLKAYQEEYAQWYQVFKGVLAQRSLPPDHTPKPHQVDKPSTFAPPPQQPLSPPTEKQQNSSSPPQEEQNSSSPPEMQENSSSPPKDVAGSSPETTDKLSVRDQDS